ncbi:MAG: glycosyltransferase family 2 protein [Kiritimatiellae bacterium]|nr:glycosyltransferase family 2 protein [Kiritimatiellia bacterium]
MLREPVSIVLPCYNEQDSIVGVISELSSTLNTAGVRAEIIVVDDGSTDGTAEKLAQCAFPIRLLRHKVNRGYGASVKDGIRAASHPYVILMDSDGQHPPKNLLLLLEEADGYDMVVGARTSQGSHHWRMPGKFLLKTLCQLLTGTRIPDINSGFRLVKRAEALKYLHLCSDEFSFSTSITLAFLSDKLAVKFVPVEIRPRKAGSSQVRLATGLSTFMLILRIIGTFNPLPIFMPPTVLIFLAGFAIAMNDMILQPEGHPNISDSALLCLLTSLILFCFGLIADQLALLRRELNKRER